MTDCKREGNFKPEEKHQCFVEKCREFCHPAKSKTCKKCNFKFCDGGHCLCDLSQESQYAIKVLYDTFCKNCSGET